MMKKLIAMLLMLCLVLTACSAPEAAPKDCSEVSQAILSSQTFPDTMTEQTQKRMLKVLGLEETMISQGVMTIDASRATAEAVIVLTAASQDTLAQVQQLLEAYRVSMLTQYRDYRPEETPKLEAAAVQTKGLQCVLVIAGDQAKAIAALETAWK